ncbi:hypothetical protein [Bifidobacterium felsineum]|uniref:hypothetical protein n=1 Tax=Bifidobacterium felsineum TaxID=2045440 RepID=UPI001BDC91BD|nr:hypothetical protein [Bifidobacterium felsineum]MBT1164640.1 hypothetical protein [Bifidobacterium felsineum]
MRISELRNLLDQTEQDWGDVEVVVDNDDPESWCPIRSVTFVELTRDGYEAASDGRPTRGALSIDLF